MNVSVIATVLNEERAVRVLLESLAAQTRRPDELVICDGGSTDGTVRAIEESVRDYGDRLGKVVLIQRPGANISRGRNQAIAKAKGPIIASTDAGVRLDRRWLERITSPWTEWESQPNELKPLAVSGFFMPAADSVFEHAMAATVLPSVEDVYPDTFLPSSRSIAFLKSTWESAGGYPEWLDYCEDLIFDFRVNDLRPDRSSAFDWRPDAVVYFRPRSTLGQFWKQYYRYARGDGKADLWRKRHAIRYVTYLVAAPALLLLAARGGAGRIGATTALVAGVYIYCRRPWQRLCEPVLQLNRGERLKAALLVPVIRAVGDMAKMTGYPVGLLWRWRHRNLAEIYWRKRSDG